MSKTRQMLKIHRNKPINSDEILEERLTKLRYIFIKWHQQDTKTPEEKTFIALKWYKRVLI